VIPELISHFVCHAFQQRENELAALQNQLDEAIARISSTAQEAEMQASTIRQVCSVQLFLGSFAS
jgi:hypothetical protein